MPNPQHVAFLEKVAGKKPDRHIKVWLNNAAKKLGIDYETIHYYHKEKRSLRISSERSHLKAISGQISKVHYQAEQLHIMQGELSHESITELRQLFTRAKSILNGSN